MKPTLFYSIIAVTMFLTFSCSSSKKSAESNSTIQPLTGSEAISDGSIVYGLPRTVFTVIVQMERTIEIPGPYASYAGDLLGLDHVTRNESESWSVENIKVKLTEELDPSELYVIESTSLFSASALALKKEGLILDLIPAASYPQTNSPTGMKEPADYNFTDLGSDEYYLTKNDTAYRRLTIDSSFVRIPYIVERKKRLTVDQLAERTAKRLMELRDGKHMILTGEANVYPQSEAAINEMNRMEKEYTELFTGKIIREKRTFTYQLIPDKNSAGKPVELFRFSELTGPLTTSTKEGVSVTVVFVPEQKTKELTNIQKKQSDPGLPRYDKLYYRIPDVAGMTISMGNEKLYTSRVIVYQFGEVIQLPANYIIGK